MAQLTSWLTDIRKTALVACIAGVLGNVIPTRNATQTLAAIASTHPVWIPIIALMYLFNAIMPVFYFALYRDTGTLRFSKNLRLLSLVAAIAFGMMATAGLIQMLAPRLGPISVLYTERAPWTINDVSSLLAEFSNLAFILLLVALSRPATDESPADVPASRLLSSVTKLAVISWGFWVAFNLVRVALAPYSYFQLRTYALQLRVTPPQLADIIADAIRTLLSQACLFIPPYVVYKGRLRRKEEPARRSSRFTLL